MKLGACSRVDACCVRLMKGEWGSVIYPPPGLPRWFNGFCTSCGSREGARGRVGEGAKNAKMQNRECKTQNVVSRSPFGPLRPVRPIGH
jgi:hypothetical protein